MLPASQAAQATMPNNGKLLRKRCNARREASCGWQGAVLCQQTQSAERATVHLATSKAIVERLVEKARSFPENHVHAAIAERDDEAVKRLVLEHLLGG